MLQEVTVCGTVPVKTIASFWEALGGLDFAVEGPSFLGFTSSKDRMLSRAAVRANETAIVKGTGATYHRPRVLVEKTVEGRSWD